MINKIVPMASPFLNYVRRGEHLWTLKMLAPGRLAPFLSPDVADRIWSLNEDGLLEQEYRNQVQASKKRLHRSTDKRNRKALEENEFGISWCLILVENYPINHHVVPCANVVDSDWNADFHSSPYDIFIEHFTASRHVTDGLTKMVSPRAAGFLKHDDAARSVLRDSAAAFGCSRCRSGLRNLRPGEGSCNREGYTE